MSCDVRTHLIEWSKGHNDTIDIRSGPMLPMAEHARFRVRSRGRGFR